MGAASFTNEWVGKGTPQEAFRELWEQAVVEYGRDPYNGTISTTSLVKVLELPPRKNLDKFIDDLWATNKNGKRETICIEVKGTILKNLLLHKYGVQSRKGYRGYIFVGLAAS